MAEIQQVDAARLTWVDTTTETIFKPPDCAILGKTPTHRSPQVGWHVNWYVATTMVIESWPILHRQVNQHIGR